MYLVAAEYYIPMRAMLSIVPLCRTGQKSMLPSMNYAIIEATAHYHSERGCKQMR